MSDKYSRKFPRLRRPKELPQPPQWHIAEYTPQQERAIARAMQSAVEFMQHFGAGRRPINNGYGFPPHQKYLD